MVDMPPVEAPAPRRPRYRLWHFRRFRSGLQGIDPKLLDPMQLPGYEPSPADFTPSPPRPPSPLSPMPDIADLRPALLCVALFWAVSLSDWHGHAELSASGERVFGQGEVWRLVTALFDHADVGHLLANTPLFLIFGWYLRAYYGALVFPVATLIIGVLSNWATISTYAPTAELLGASGMLYGMVALWLVLYIRHETQHSRGGRIFRAIGVTLLLLFPTSFERTTSYTAHATGYAIGLVVGLCLLPVVRLRRPTVGT